MDSGVFFVVHVWRDARGFHATAREVTWSAPTNSTTRTRWPGIWPCTLRYRRRPNRTDPVKQ